jgi:hypothetical protein
MRKMGKHSAWDEVFAGLIGKKVRLVHFDFFRRSMAILFEDGCLHRFHALIKE